LQHATGEVLEIGAGTGINLPHYPTTVTRLVLSEPDQQMRLKLANRLSQYKNRHIDITAWGADNITTEDHSFDTIVSTLVLCSVPDQPAALAEVQRLLRPGGKLIFLEHILSDHPSTRRWQHRLEPVWSLCAGDCKLTRDTATAIKTAGFTIEQLTDAPMVGTPPFVSRTIRGIATKPSSAELHDSTNYCRMTFFPQTNSRRIQVMAKASARHILVPTEDDCNKLKEEIVAGADFAEVAKKHSKCPSGKQGGALGEFTPGQMVKEFDDVVFSGEVGKVLGPVKTQFGYHLIEVTNRTE